MQMIRRLLLALPFVSLLPKAPAAQGHTIPCERQDCRLFLIEGSTTLMGWHPELDKNGNRTGRMVDPNVYSHTYDCATCRKRFTVSSRQDVVGWRRD